MYGQSAFSEIDWTKYRPTRLKVFAACALLLAIAVSVSFTQFANTKDNILPAGAPLGGDYVAFYAASHALNAGEAGDIYDQDTFYAWIEKVGPKAEDLNLLWQYPPTYYIFIFPLAFLGFAQGYILFTGLTAASFFATLRVIGADRLTLFAVLASPSVFHATITGQNGFFTAMLLCIAAYYPSKRPIIAGLAAALLTVKPQLGILLPFAYILGGCWRAFFTAATGTIAMAAAATAFFGIEIWLQFQEGLANTTDKFGGGLFPVYKMPTPFAAAMHASAPGNVALGIHMIFALSAIGLVAHVWRNMKDAPLRAAILVSCVFLVAPYGYYYEMVLLAPAVVILAQRAVANGFLKYEQYALIACYIFPMAMPAPEGRPGIGYGLLCVLLILGCVLRRINHDHPHVFVWIKDRFPHTLISSRPPTQSSNL